MFHRFEYKMNRVICSHSLTHVHRQQHRRGLVNIYNTHDIKFVPDLFELEIKSDRLLAWEIRLPWHCLSLEGQCDVDTGSLPFFTGGGNTAAVQKHNVLHNAEAQPGAP